MGEGLARIKMTKPTQLVALVVVAAIAYWTWNNRQEAKRAERSTARAASVAADLNKPPTFREIATPQGTLLEVRFPVDQLGVGFVETQVCYVWRDAALQTASLACPGQPSIDTGTP